MYFLLIFQFVKNRLSHKRIIQNLVVVEANPAENYILVSGNVPGAKQSLVLIKSAAKNERKAENNELVSYETVVDSVASDNTEAKEESQEN